MQDVMNVDYDPDTFEMRPRLRHGIVEFPVHHVRGGTSTGLVIRDGFAPRDVALREELLRHLMGVPLQGSGPGNRQITGLGRGAPTSNKVFFAEIETGDAGSIRLVSTLAQLASDKAAIDWGVNCGNMSSALPFWALDTGLLRAAPGAATFDLDIYNTNTGVLTASRVRLGPDGLPVTTVIPGVDGAWPAVDLFLRNPVGSKTERLLPTEHAVDTIRGIEVSCVDVAVPMVIARAADFGRTAHEPIEALETDPLFMDKLRAVWVEAGLRMGLKSRAGSPMTADELMHSETVPKVCIVGPPREGGHIATRYFTPQAGHRSMAVSGGCCLAAAALLPGTVAHEIAHGVGRVGPVFEEFQVSIENPAGILNATIDACMTGEGLHIRKAAYERSAQILLAGYAPLYRASTALLDRILSGNARPRNAHPR